MAAVVVAYFRSHFPSQHRQRHIFLSLATICLVTIVAIVSVTDNSNNYYTVDTLINTVFFRKIGPASNDGANIKTRVAVIIATADKNDNDIFAKIIDKITEQIGEQETGIEVSFIFRPRNVANMAARCLEPTKDLQFDYVISSTIGDKFEQIIIASSITKSLLVNGLVAMASDGDDDDEQVTTIIENDGIFMLNNKSINEPRMQPFTFDFFAGPVGNVGTLCEKVQECFQRQNLPTATHLKRCFNLYLRGGEVPAYVIVDGDYLPYSKDLMASVRTSLMTALEIRRFPVDAKRRRKQVDVIVQRLQDRYFQKVGKDLSNLGLNWYLVKQFLGYSCELSTLCGGFGDRLKGVAALFYMAIATDRIFYFDWQKPINIDRFFHINADWYSVDHGIFRHQQQLARQHRQWWWPMDADANQLADQIANGTFIKHNYLLVDALDITTNRFRILEPIFKNKAFSSKIGEFFPELMTNFDSSVGIDYSLAISAVYRSLLSKPRQDMLEIVESVIGNVTSKEIWQNSLKIGLQLRTLRVGWGEDGWRVHDSQFHCFADKVRQIAAKHSTKNKTVIVFVTSDSENATDFIRQNLATSSFLVFGTTQFFRERYNITTWVKHLDRSFVPSNKRGLMEVAKIYVDWLFLTRMDFLLISRSGFGETASLYSLAPSWQFVHWPPRKNNICPFDYYNGLNDITFNI